MSKKTSRREFIELELKSSLALPLLASGLYSCKPTSEEQKLVSDLKKLKILIIGGKSFLCTNSIHIK